MVDWYSSVGFREYRMPRAAASGTIRSEWNAA